MVPVTDIPAEKLRSTARYIRDNPDSGVMDVLGAEALPPTARDIVSDLLDAQNPTEAVEDLVDEGTPATEGPAEGADGEPPDGRGARDAPDTTNTDEAPGEGPDTDNTPENGEAAYVERAKDAFGDAIRYFHQQLDRTIGDHTDTGTHPDRPTTAREYFTEGRGWDDDTLDDNLLGYAPAGDGLRDYLMEQGHDRETIIATGLFTDNLQPLWKGRYVLPYFDADGEPVYAIGRCTGGKGGGAAGYDGHPSDYLAGKYAKVRHTDDRVPFAEPIWGQHTLEDGEPVVIAEGIADAITAHERGYSVLSPVTKEFKEQHQAPVLDILTDHNVGRVYVVGDNDPLTFDENEIDREDPTIGDILTIPRATPGVEGALKTAEFLDDHDIDVRVAFPPAQLGEKNDLDEYLHGWADTPAPLLRSARPPEAFPEYHSIQKTRETTRDGHSSTFDDENDGEGHTGDNRSALWDLDLADILNASEGDRGKNPLSHTGDSENYFVYRKGSEGDLVARDYKRGVVYNALTYLLVKEGERRASDPQGSLNDNEVYKAWKQAKADGHLGDDDPVPYRAILHIARRDDLADEDDIPDGSGDQSLPAEAYNEALDIIDEETGGHGRTKTNDPTELTVTLDPRTAWRAVSLAGPDKVDGDLPLDDDGDRWICPDCGATLDVVRAVGMAEDRLPACDVDLDDDTYHDLYERARDAYGAALPEYVDHRTATENYDHVQGALRQLTHHHLDTDAFRSTITENHAHTDNDLRAEIDPVWENSKSGRRIIAFESGMFYCRKHEAAFDPLRFVALENGLIHDCDGHLAGDDFWQAYNLAREEYGAPLPAFKAKGVHHTAVLPDPDELVGEFATDADSLQRARKEVEDLYLGAVEETNKAQLLTPLPATGKTTSVAKHATKQPALYLAGRKELMKEVEEKAQKWGASHAHLPVLSSRQPDEEALIAATGAVRERGRDLLKDPDDLAEAAPGEIFPEDDDEAPDAEEIDLDRATCPTASGSNGDVWGLRVHVARKLGHTPRDIHVRDVELFGEPLPCQHDDEECPYSEGWERVTDPEAPFDILIGHYGHAHVEGARSYKQRGKGDRIRTTPRAVVLDEFPGDVFGTTAGEQFVDTARWLAGCLRADIDDRTDLHNADLWNDEWVRAWLDGDGDEHPVGRMLTSQLLAAEHVTNVVQAADDLREREDLPDALDDALDALPDEGAEWCGDDVRDAYAAAQAAVNTLETDGGSEPGERTKRDVIRESLAARTREEILQPLASVATIFTGDDDLADHGIRSVPPVPFDKDRALGRLYLDAIQAALDGEDRAEARISLARDALKGGEDGARALALNANDGYAHPDAHRYLYGLLAEGDEATTIELENFSYDLNDGTRVDHVEYDQSTLLVDRNNKGITMLTPPEFTAGGKMNPTIGLDATGRERLWEIAIGREVERRDIHGTPRARRRFLRDVLNLQVVQTTPHAKTYEGSVSSKNFDGDVELVKNIADTFGGERLRSDSLTTTKKPGVITTKVVEDHLEDRLDSHVGEIEHYGNLIGSNALAQYRLGVVLGCSHHGHASPEKWAALAGEQPTISGRGMNLDYGTPTGNAFLKRMWHDRTMQAVLRFGRDETGAVVFCHTAALREDLPVVGEGRIVKTFSKNAQAIADAAREHVGREFTVQDILDDDRVTCAKRTVQRTLKRFSELGYMQLADGGDGRSSSFVQVDEPGTADVDLGIDPGETALDGDGPRHSAYSEYYTWSVAVNGGDGPPPARFQGVTATLPAPTGEIGADPPSSAG